MIVQLWFRLLSWWSALLHCGLIDDDIETELQFHIDSYTPQLIEGCRAGRTASEDRVWPRGCAERTVSLCNRAAAI